MAKYSSKDEAIVARLKLIDIAKSTGVIAPCDENTGVESVVFVHKPWSVGQVTSVK